MLTTILDIILRSGIIYIIVLLGLRLLGKSHIGQLSILDFVLILLISNAVQNAMVGNDSSLLGGIIAAATLLLMNYLFTFIRMRFRKAGQLFEGNPSLLIHNGKILREHLEKEQLTEDELERVIREHGLEHSSNVKIAVMESDGTISVIPMSEEVRHIETFKHRRMKFQQRREG